MQDMFSSDSPEAQGSLSVYIVGGMIGSVLGFVMNKYKMSRYERGSHG